MNEDDTFNALRRIPFEDLIYNHTFHGESITMIYKFIIDKVTQGQITADDNWPRWCGGWSWEDFHAECVKRHMEACTPDDPNFPALRKR